MASCHCVLLFFPLHLSKVLCLPRTNRSYKVLHLSRKITLANLKIWCAKMQDLSRNQHLDLQTSLMTNMSLVLRRPRDMHFRRSSSHVPRLPTFLIDTATKPSHFARMWKSVLRPPVFHTSDFEIYFAPQHSARLNISTSQICWAWQFLALVTSTCASHHNGVHFFIISTGKNDPNMCCLVHFDLEMCFVLKRCANVQHLNS